VSKQRHRKRDLACSSADSDRAPARLPLPECATPPSKSPRFISSALRRQSIPQNVEFLAVLQCYFENLVDEIRVVCEFVQNLFEHFDLYVKVHPSGPFKQTSPA